MPSSVSSSHSATIPAQLTAPLLPTSSVSSTSEASHEQLPTQNAEQATTAHLSGSGAKMQMLLNAAHVAASGMAKGVSTVYDGTLALSAAGYNNILKPAGSAVTNTAFAAVRNLAEFAQETATGTVHVKGHQVSGRADSVLKLPQRLIPASVKELFTPDEKSLSEKGLAFLKNVGTYSGGMAASFIYQMVIVGIADTIGRVSAQATSDELEEGNFAVPLAVTGALTLVATAQIAFLLKNMNLSDLSENQKSTVISAHHGITQEEFDAKPDAEKEVLEAKTKRDWLMMAGGAALMPAGAFAMSLIGKLSPTTALANPLFMTIAVNMTKEVVRSALYGGLREAAQEVFTGPKGGSANLTHSEAGWAAIKYVGIETAVDQGQSAAQRAVLHNPLLAPANAWSQAAPSTAAWGDKLSAMTASESQATRLVSTWKEKVSVLGAYSVVNAMGEVFNWADDTSDRAKKCAALVEKNLKEQHAANGMPEPTSAELKAAVEHAEFAFGLGVKDQTFGEALRNIGRRAGGSMITRRGLYAYVNAMATALAKLESMAGTPDTVNSVLVSVGISLAYIKFNACAQSLGTLRGIRAENENKKGKITIEELA